VASRKHVHKAKPGLRQSLRLVTPIVLLSVGVLFPVVLTSAGGIVALALWENPRELVLGILSVIFGVAAGGTAIVVTVILGRRSKLARLQSDLLGAVSHELKTPIAGIRLYAQTLQQDGASAKPEVVQECSESIVRETEWLTSVVDTLLTWRAAAKDRDNLVLRCEPLQNAVNQAAQRFSRMVMPGECEFDVRLHTELCVQHDPAAIGIIIMNLLTNSFKYSTNPKRISLLARDEGTDVVISVRDNGIGISPSEAKRIFEPFYRVDNRLTSGASGAGLGLAIVDHLVGAHGGTVQVFSDVGKGALFEIRLPSSAPPNPSGAE